MRSVAGEALRLGVGQGSGKALSFLAFLFVARVLGPGDYGAFTFALSLGSLLIFLPNLGVDPLASREVSSGREDAGRLLGIILVLKTAAGGVFLLLYLAVIHLSPTSAAARESAPLLGAALVLLAFGQTWRTFLVVGGRAAAAGMLDVIAPAVFVLGCALWLTSRPATPTAALAFLSGQVAATSLGAFIVLRAVRLARLPRSAEPYRRVLRSALPLMVVWMLSDLYLRIDMTLLYYLRGDNAAGLYGASYRLVEGIYSGALVICTVSLPRLARAWSVTAESWRGEWWGSRRALLAVVTPPAALMLVAPGPVIGLLYGPAFGASAASLRVLGPATVLLCLGYLYGAALTSLGREWAQMTITAVALSLNVVLNLLWIPALEGVGAALATLCSAFVYLALAHGVMQRTVHAGAVTRPLDFPAPPSP